MYSSSRRLFIYLQILTGKEPGSGLPGRRMISTFEAQARLRPQREIYDPLLKMSMGYVGEVLQA